MAEGIETSKRRFKSKLESKKNIMSYFRNKRTIISNNVYKHKSEISQELKDYKIKNDFNISLYKKHSKSSQNFMKAYSLLKKKKKEKEKDLINNIRNDYLLKKKMKVSKKEMKENIFELSSLIEPNLSKLEMDYLLNYSRIMNEIKENQSLKNDIDEFRRTMYPNKRKGNYLDNRTQIRNKLLNQVNSLNDVKFMKKMNIMAKSKMIDNELIKEDLIIRKIKHQIKELKKKGKIEDILNAKKRIKRSLIDIENLKKNIKNYEKEENNKLLNNLASKTTRDDKNKSLFYIPTIVKSFPELLYDKLNKDKSSILKNNATNDSTSRTLMRKKEKSTTERIINEKKSNILNKTTNNFLRKFNEELSIKKKVKIKEMKEEIFKKLNLNKTMREIKNRNEEKMSETTRVYNKILNMSFYNRNSKNNEIFMRTFLKDRNYLYIDSVNEKRPKNYLFSLKNIHSQFSTDKKAKILYQASDLLENKKSIKLFNELTNFQNTLRQNENLLLKTLLIEKE